MTTKRAKCSVCEKPVARGPNSNPDIVCRDCRGYKPYTNTKELICERCFKRFTAIRKGGGVRAYCDSCQPIVRGESNQRSEAKKRASDKYKERNRANALSAIYGLNPGHIDLMLDEQDDKCAICRTGEPGGKYNQWQVDHSHMTGKVRGLLCGNCNTLLGMANDDIDVLRAAIHYLREHRDRETGGSS